LPPGWKADVPRLEHFLKALPRDAQHVLEFREPSWYSDEIYELMSRHRVSLCLHDMQRSATGRFRVGPIVYVRFHGPTGRYHGGYPAERLAVWAEWLRQEADSGADVFAYFNNDVGGHAPRDAVTLREMLNATPDRPWGVAREVERSARRNAEAQTRETRQ
jgi:uncharacterized protein YecE (DUF72 family)